MASGLPAQPPPGQGREIHLAGGSFICGTIKARGRDPCRRRESDLPADGFIISQAQQFGLNETKPLLLMKTPLMSGASEGRGVRGGSANGVSAVLRAGATAWCPNHEAKAGGLALFGPGTARGGPSSCPTPRDVMLKEQFWPLHCQNPAWPWQHRPRCPPLPRLLGVTAPPPRRQSPPGAQHPFRKGRQAPREAIPRRGGAVNKPGQQRGPRQGGTDARGREAADRRGGQATLPSPWEGAASAGTFGTGGPHGSPHPGGSPFLAGPHPNQGFPGDIGDLALGTAQLPAQPHRRAAEQQQQAEGWVQGVAAAAGGGGGLGGSRGWEAGLDPTGKDLGACARSSHSGCPSTLSTPQSGTAELTPSPWRV